MSMGQPSYKRKVSTNLAYTYIACFLFMCHNMLKYFIVGSLKTFKGIFIHAVCSDISYLLDYI
jgi:hypothetical protein